MVAAVVPASSAPGLESLLVGYAALADQLGGQFAVRNGAPAAALTAFADEHRVTEMLLARRELARTRGDVEIHVLPAMQGSLR